MMRFSHLKIKKILVLSIYNILFLTACYIKNTSSFNAFSVNNSKQQIYPFTIKTTKKIYPYSSSSSSRIQQQLQQLQLAVKSPSSSTFTTTTKSLKAEELKNYLKDDGNKDSTTIEMNTKKEVKNQLATTTNEKHNYNWDFLDAVYLITCPNADTNDNDSSSSSSSRLDRVKEILSNVNLLDKVQIMEFETDDEDRVRGCYTSHMSVLRKARDDITTSTSNKKQQEWWKNFLFSSKSNGITTNDNNIKKGKEGDDNKLVLVLEDNLSISNKFTPSLLSSIESFISSNNNQENSMALDIMHLSYTPFVPNFYIERLVDSSSNNNNNIIQLNCGIQSALGTTSYIISQSGINAMLKQDSTKQGYYGVPIPDVMTEIFTNCRYAIYPIPFIRSFSTKSLVNPQLDTLRQILFVPSLYSIIENILVITGISTNLFLKLSITILAFISFYSIHLTFMSIQAFFTSGGSSEVVYSGNIFLSVLCGIISIFSLGIIAIGIILAPKEPQQDEVEED